MTMFGLKKPSGKYEFMIVGLGNPGLKYRNTRHNAGFAAIDILAEHAGVKIDKKQKNALVADALIGGKRCLLVKPQTFMNLSGEAVVPLAQYYKIPYENIIIMFDDIEFDVGKLRIRRNGSHGGHNGVKNIIALSGSSAPARIKIGVGKKPRPEYDLKDWVLGKIPLNLSDEFEKTLCRAADAAEELVKNGVDSAMNKFNG